MGIQERPFENIISMNNSLSGDPINELITLNKLERSIYSEGRKLETIILLSGMTPKDRWIYISLILDDLLYQYDSSCRKVRGMNTNTLLYKRALLLKKAIVEVMEVTSTRLKIAFDIDYIKEREERYATMGAARWDDSTDKKLDLDIVENMRYFNDLISGKIDRYLENCKSRFTKKYDDDKLKAIWLHLKEENYINSNTSLSISIPKVSPHLPKLALAFIFTYFLVYHLIASFSFKNNFAPDISVLTDSTPLA